MIAAPVFLAEAVAGEELEGSGQVAEELELPRDLYTRVMKDYYGNTILPVSFLLLVLYVVFRVHKRAREVSNYGEGLDRNVRVQIRKYEVAEKFGQAGDVLFSHGAWADATELYEKAGDWIRAGEAQEKAGNLSKAANYFRRAGAPMLGGEALMRRKQYAAAAREFIEADALDQAAECLAKAKEYAKAAELFLKIDRLREAGLCYDRLGQSLKAAELYEQDFNRQYELSRGALHTISDACEMAERAGDILVQAGENERAAALYQKAGHSIKAAEIYKTLGDVGRAATLYTSAGDSVHALKLYEAVGDTESAHRHRAQMRLEQGDVSGAASDFAQAGEHLRAAELFLDAGDHLRSAESYMRAGDARAAADLFRTAGEHIKAAQAFELAGDFGMAAGIYAQLGDTNAQIGAAKKGRDFFQVGQLYLDKGMKEEALAALQQVDSHSADFEKASVSQGDLLSSMGRFDVAFQKYRAALGEAPVSQSNVFIAYKMARAAESGGATSQALQLYDTVLGVDYYYKDAAQRAEQLRADGVQTVFGASLDQRVGSSPNNAPGQTLGVGAQPDSSTSSQAAGDGTPRYEILDEIARGGMGVVYRARDQVLDRVVAFKVLSANLKTNKVAVKYFLREAKAAAQMSHPNIVTVFDAGEQSGEFYMAMEFVEGQTLKNLVVRQGPFPEKLIRYIIIHACRALQYAHDRGLVHRDIKPGNIMLAKDRSLKIMDFGLAKFLEEAQAGHTKAIGTPYYISPEQILGKDLDHRSDIYSLGVSLFECATGRVPFTKGDLSYHHINTDPPRVHDLNPEISVELSEVIYRCMAKDPEQRYASANDLAAAIR